jgi:hypothetical protein
VIDRGLLSMKEYYYHGFSGKATFRSIKKHGLCSNNKTFARKRYSDSKDNALYLTDNPELAVLMALHRHGKKLMFIAAILKEVITAQLYVDENFPTTDEYYNHAFYVLNTTLTVYDIVRVDICNGYVDIRNTVGIY